MTSALIVGSRGAGLTTFVGLFYTAQVRLATEEGATFRFHADRETLHELDSLYTDLGDGRFPGRDVDWEEHTLSFVLSFRTRRFRLFAGRGPKREREVGGSEVRVGGMTTEELAELREHDHVLGDSTGRMLHSQVVIPLVDASRLRPRSVAAPASTASVDDAPLAATLEILRRYLSTESRRAARTMHPLFVLTKLDRCAQETLTELQAPPGRPEAWSLENRQRMGRAVLERYLPATCAWLAAADSGAPVPIAPPRWYFSSLQVEEDGGVPRIARRSRLPAGGWEPEYPYAEYRALIEYLGWLSQRLPDVSGR